MKHFLIAAAVAATLGAPAHAQADVCSKFTTAADQARCRSELTQAPPAVPYCLPVTGQQMQAVRSGRRVVVPGVGGCAWEWN
jgi:hypothetical protein